MALASTNKTEEAQAELDILNKDWDAMSPDVTVGFNSGKTIVKIAGAMLGARVSVAKNDRKTAIESLEAAAKVEDSLAYDEPPDWYLPVREMLGAVLMAGGRYAEAAKAFRDELVRHPKSGRSLFGLSEALKAQKKSAEARRIHAQFRLAWKYADTKLTLAEL
jgi:predicted Zn-dependent protease